MSTTQHTTPPGTSPLSIAATHVDHFVRAAQVKTRLNYLYVSLLALLMGAVYVVANLNALEGFRALALPLIILITVATPIVGWYLPKVVLYFTFASVCLFEIVPTGMPDAITDQIPVFWNLNTIVQTFAKVNFKAFPFSFFECVLIIAALCSLLRSVFTQTTHLRAGPLFKPILGYMFFVFIGLVVGLGSGGDFKIALQEVRPQFYIAAIYLMAVNLVTERRQIEHFLWITAICFVLKGALYTFRQYITLHNAPLPDQGVGSHEEAFLFDCYFVLLLSLLLCGSRPKLRSFMLYALPLVVLGNLSTNRRAGTAALAVLIPVFFVAAYRALPNRRRLAAIVGISMALVFGAYYQVFKNRTGSLALPARSIKSQFQPDPRDASSNQYRDAENADQLATIRSAPLGYGYGKHFLHAVPIADISNFYEWWDLIPHNQILWVWMRTGTQGFIAFWIMISSSVIYCCQVFRDDSIELDLRVIGLFTIMVIGSLLIFGLLDLQLSNPRDVIFTAFWMGATVRAQMLGKPEKTRKVTQEGATL